MKILTFILAIPLFGCGADSKYADKISWPVIASSACDSYSDSRTIITKSTVLPKDCVITNAELIITASNVSFDCNYAVIHNDSSITSALWVQAKAGTTRPVNSGFTNCQVLGGSYGFRPHLQLSHTEAATLRADRSATLPYLYANAPMAAYVTNSIFVNQVNEAAYFWVGAQNTHFTGNHVYNAGATCLYLTSGTKNSVITDNHFEHCGYTKANGWPRISRQAKRECLAVDGANNNVIADNTFIDCADESVAIYWNDEEFYPISWDGRVNPNPDLLAIPRIQDASRNRLVGNNSYKSGYGVAFSVGQRFDTAYTASRYSGRTPYFIDNGNFYFYSGASHTTVAGNRCNDDSIEFKGDYPVVGVNTACVARWGSAIRTRAGIPTLR